ncbi:hypothetical protein GGF48_005519, partial [Coemansia sp. RSA 921]
MDITQLPSELLDLVFGQFANILLSDDPNLTLWKDVLPLVGVSRQWRALATRHVYKYLFIECHDEEEVVDEDEMDDTESIDQITWSNLQYMDICVNTAIENPDNSADNNNDTMAQNLEQAAS